MEEYKNVLIKDIKEKYLFDVNFDLDKVLDIEDIIDMPMEISNYLEEHELFKRNVQVLLRKISLLINSNVLSSIKTKKKLEDWYITTTREFQNYYREFAIASCESLSNNEIYEISLKKSLREVIISVYESITNSKLDEKTKAR